MRISRADLITSATPVSPLPSAQGIEQSLDSAASRFSQIARSRNQQPSGFPLQYHLPSNSCTWDNCTIMSPDFAPKTPRMPVVCRNSASNSRFRIVQSHILHAFTHTFDISQNHAPFFSYTYAQQRCVTPYPAYPYQKHPGIPPPETIPPFAPGWTGDTLTAQSARRIFVPHFSQEESDA
jgi:hypothetical protein